MQALGGQGKVARARPCDKVDLLMEDLSGERQAAGVQWGLWVKAQGHAATWARVHALSTGDPPLRQFTPPLKLSCSGKDFVPKYSCCLHCSDKCPMHLTNNARFCIAAAACGSCAWRWRHGAQPPAAGGRSSGGACTPASGWRRGAPGAACARGCTPCRRRAWQQLWCSHCIHDFTLHMRGLWAS